MRLNALRGWLIAIALSTVGCVDSTFYVPYPAGERPSPLWASDPRTADWDSVHVAYDLYPGDRVGARVRSGDRKHRFRQRGTKHYLRPDGTLSDSWVPDSMLLVEFDGRREWYRFEPGGSGRTRMLVADPPTMMTSAGRADLPPK